MARQLSLGHVVTCGSGVNPGLPNFRRTRAFLPLDETRSRDADGAVDFRAIGGAILFAENLSGGQIGAFGPASALQSVDEFLARAARALVAGGDGYR